MVLTWSEGDELEVDSVVLTGSEGDEFQADSMVHVDDLEVKVAHCVPHRLGAARVLAGDGRGPRDERLHVFHAQRLEHVRVQLLQQYPAMYPTTYSTMYLATN